jgi:hypothetical protein
MGTTKQNPVNTSRKTINELWPATRASLSSFSITSPETWKYNCVAWALGVTTDWYEPSPAGIWPLPSQGFGVAVYSDLFEHFGYAQCADGKAEKGYEKVVIYANSAGEFTHVARQLTTGKWTSKLGELSDITHHSPEVLISAGYGRPAVYLRRAVPLKKAAQVT